MDPGSDGDLRLSDERDSDDNFPVTQMKYSELHKTKSV